MKLTDEHITLLRQLARSSAEKGGLCTGTLILDKEGNIFTFSESLAKPTNDATAHAERLAIEKACKLKKNWIIPEYTLVTVFEPCLMCLGAIYWAGIREIYFIYAGSEFWHITPWVTETPKIKKEELIKKFPDPPVYAKLSNYQVRFNDIVDQYISIYTDEQR